MQQRQSSQTATQTETVNYDLLKSKILTALNNRSNLEEFYTKIIINSSEYNSFGAFKTYLLNYNKALEDKIKVDYYVNQLSPKVIFTAIINGLYSLNNPSLNTFIIDVENQMKRLENDPAFSSTETPEINFIPIIPMTVTDTTRPQSVPKLPVASNITISTNKPENINVVSRTGPVPVYEDIETKIKLYIPKMKSQINKKENITQNEFIGRILYTLFNYLYGYGNDVLNTVLEKLTLNNYFDLSKIPSTAIMAIGGLSIINTIYNYFMHLRRGVKYAKDAKEFFETEGNLNMETILKFLKDGKLDLNKMAEILFKNTNDKSAYYQDYKTEDPTICINELTKDLNEIYQGIRTANPTDRAALMNTILKNAIQKLRRKPVPKLKATY